MADSMRGVVRSFLWSDLPAAARQRLARILRRDDPLVPLASAGAALVNAGWIVLAGLGLLFWARLWEAGAGVAEGDSRTHGVTHLVGYGLASFCLVWGVLSLLQAVRNARSGRKPGRYLLPFGYLDTRAVRLRFVPLLELECDVSQAGLTVKLSLDGQPLTNLPLRRSEAPVSAALETHRQRLLVARERADAALFRELDPLIDVTLGRLGRPARRERLVSWPRLALAATLALLVCGVLERQLLPRRAVALAEASGSQARWRSIRQAYDVDWVRQRADDELGGRLERIRTEVTAHAAPGASSFLKLVLAGCDRSTARRIPVVFAPIDASGLADADRRLLAQPHTAGSAWTAGPHFKHDLPSAAKARVLDGLRGAVAAHLPPDVATLELGNAAPAKAGPWLSVRVYLRDSDRVHPLVTLSGKEVKVLALLIDVHLTLHAGDEAHRAAIRFESTHAPSMMRLRPVLGPRGRRVKAPDDDAAWAYAELAKSAFDDSQRRFSEILWAR